MVMLYFDAAGNNEKVEMQNEIWAVYESSSQRLQFNKTRVCVNNG